MVTRCRPSILIALLLSAIPAGAQMSTSWNVDAYQRAQANNSLAMTYLNSPHASAAKIKKAADLLRQATQKDPTDPIPYLNLGNLLLSQGQYAEAEDCLQKSYSLRHSSEAMLSAGICHYLQHDYDAAINCWKKVTDANPQHCRLFADMGMAFVRKGQLSAAVDNFKHAVRETPTSSFGYYGLALTHYLGGDLSSAREEADRACALQSYAPVYLLRSQIDFLQGDAASGRRDVSRYNSLMHNGERSMADLGFSSQNGFHWDPFLADNYDNGNFVLARERSRQRTQTVHGTLSGAINTASHALADSEMMDVYSLKHSHANVHPSKAMLTTGLDGGLSGDLYITHELGLLKLSEGDYSSAAGHFEAVLAESDECAVELLYLAKALALDGRTAEAAEKVAEYHKRWPGQQIASAFDAIQTLPPVASTEEKHTRRVTERQSPAPRAIPASEF